MSSFNRCRLSVVEEDDRRDARHGTLAAGARSVFNVPRVSL